MSEPLYAPATIAKIRAEEARLRERVNLGLMSAAEAAEARKTFISLSMAHVREHGPEDRA